MRRRWHPSEDCRSSAWPDTRCSTEASDGRELRQRLRQAH